MFFFFFSSRRRHTRCGRDWSSDVCSSDLYQDLMKSLSFNSKAKHAYFQAIHYSTEQEMDTVQRQQLEEYIERNKKIREVSPVPEKDIKEIGRASCRERV